MKSLYSGVSLSGKHRPFYLTQVYTRLNSLDINVTKPFFFFKWQDDVWNMLAKKEYTSLGKLWVFLEKLYSASFLTEKSVCVVSVREHKQIFWGSLFLCLSEDYRVQTMCSGTICGRNVALRTKPSRTKLFLKELYIFS